MKIREQLQNPGTLLKVYVHVFGGSFDLAMDQRKEINCTCILIKVSCLCIRKCYNFSILSLDQF